MSLYSKVAWKDGMFLLPQHFQQAERALEASHKLQLLAPRPLTWGVVELEISERALAEGRVELVRCKAILPDGTVADIPSADQPPAALALRPSVAERVTELFLTLPAVRGGTPLVAASPEQAAARFIERSLEVADDHEPDRTQTIEVAVKNLSLAATRDALTGMVALKLGEIERAPSGQWMMRSSYIPPCPLISASPILVSRLEELISRVTAKIEEIAQQRRQYSGDAMEFSAAGIKSLMLHSALSSHLPALRHFLLVPGTSPALLYAELLRLFGSLLVFSPRAASSHPPYDHEAIGTCFDGLIARIYELLGVVVRRQYSIIELAHTRNAWDGFIAEPALRERGEYYLVATGQVQQSEYERLPSACKIAESGRVESLARTANPGLALEPVARPRSPAPVKDAVYFRLRTEGSLWEEVKGSGKIGIYIPRSPEGLQLELLVLHDDEAGR